MEIVRLPVGERAPRESDCISIEQLADGTFSLTGSLLAEEESVALMSGVICPTRESAEEQGLAWAGNCGVATLYVSTTLNA